MSLADDLATAPKRSVHGTRCGFCTWFHDLTPDMQQLVLDALADPARDGARLDEVWAKHGWKWTRGATQRHRNNQCMQWARERTG